MKWIKSVNRQGEETSQVRNGEHLCMKQEPRKCIGQVGGRIFKYCRAKGIGGEDKSLSHTGPLRIRESDRDAKAGGGPQW